MADQETRCPACGEDTGDSKYCPFCGERVFKEAPGEQPTASMPSIEPVESSTPPETPPPPGFAPPPEVAAPHGSTAAPDLAGPPRVAPPPVMKASPPVFKGPTQALPAEPRKKKRTGLAVALILIAVLCIGGAVAAVFLLTGNSKTSLTIQSPSKGSTVDGNSVKVKLAVSGTGKVETVEVFVDSEKRATITSAPYQTTLGSVENGKHSLSASALDASGSVLARASGTFTSEGKTGKPPDGGPTGQDQSAAFKNALASEINEATTLNDRIARDADLVNTEVNFTARVVPASLLAEVRALNASASSLTSTADTLSAPADMKDLELKFEILCGYLQVRPDALLKGLQAVDSGGDYAAEFDRGAKAKASFDAAWPSFLAACRSKGVSI